MRPRLISVADAEAFAGCSLQSGKGTFSEGANAAEQISHLFLEPLRTAEFNANSSEVWQRPAALCGRRSSAIDSAAVWTNLPTSDLSVCGFYVGVDENTENAL